MKNTINKIINNSKYGFHFRTTQQNLVFCKSDGSVRVDYTSVTSDNRHFKTENPHRVCETSERIDWSRTKKKEKIQMFHWNNHLLGIGKEKKYLFSFQRAWCNVEDV